MRTRTLFAMVGLLATMGGLLATLPQPAPSPFERVAFAQQGAIAVKLPAVSVRPEQFGAVGNGVVDDAAAIQRAIDTAGDDGLVQFTPDKNYRIASTLTMTYQRQKWVLTGATITRSGNGIAVQIGIPNPSASLEKVWGFQAYGGRIFRSSTDYTAGNIGVQFLNTNNSDWYDFWIEGFATGIELLGDGGTGNRFIGNQYSTLRPHWIANCKLPIRIFATRNGWCNGSNWYGGGRVGFYSTGESAAGSYALVLDRDTSNGEVINEHNFHGLTFEDAFSALDPKKPAAAIYANCADCVWNGGRVEGFTSPKIICTGDDFSGCSFENIQSLLLPSQDFSLPTGPRTVHIMVNRALYVCEGSGTTHSSGSDPAMVLRERSDAAGIVFAIRQTDNTERIRLRADGRIAKKTSTLWGRYEGASFGGSKSWNPGTINAGATATTTVTISGPGGSTGLAISSNPCLAALSNWKPGLVVSAHIDPNQTAGFNTAVVLVKNETGSNITVDDGGTITVHVQQMDMN